MTVVVANGFPTPGRLLEGPTYGFDHSLLHSSGQFMPCTDFYHFECHTRFVFLNGGPLHPKGICE